jgi:hypothetical protein
MQLNSNTIKNDYTTSGNKIGKINIMRRRKRNMRSWKKETNKNMLILLG